MFSFELVAKDDKARAGILVTPHGPIETPSFVAVGTQATVKALSQEELRKIGTQVIITNAYHLHLQPGENLIEKMGGLHEFMSWNGPLMTDSGGFQIFSLGAGKEHGVGKIAPIFPDEMDRGGHLSSKKGTSLVRVDEEGVEFTSYLDGSRHRFTPEQVMDIERRLGADIILPLDECTSPLHDYAYTKAAMERTHRWALRALEEFGRFERNQALLGIVQGGAYRDLREESALFIGAQEFHGYAIGGSLGRSKKEMCQVLEWTIPLLPQDKLRHLLGIGEVSRLNLGRVLSRRQQLAHFRLYRHAFDLGAFRYVSGALEILIKRQYGAVEHDGSEAGVQSGPDVLFFLGMVQMHGNRNRSAPGDVPHDHGGVFQPLIGSVTGVAHEDNRRFLLLGDFDDGPRDIVVAAACVDRRHSEIPVARRLYQRRGCHKAHFVFLSLILRIDLRCHML